MHELSLCQAIVDTVQPLAGGSCVRQVNVRVGYLRQVVPDSLLFSWDVVTMGTPLAGCGLDIEHVPAVVVCADCGAHTTLDLPVPACAECSSGHVELISGEEFTIVSLDVTDAALDVADAAGDVG